MARALILNDELRGEISRIVKKARERCMPYEEAVRAAAFAEKSGVTTNDYNEALTLKIPVGFHVTYTHEEQRPGLACRHISISLDNAKPGSGPHPAAVDMLLEAYGYVNRVGGLATWLTELPDGTTVVEALEPLDGNMDHLRRAPDASA